MLRAIRVEGGTVRAGGREVGGPGAPLWVDMGPDPSDLAWLADRFGFHPLALEDCAHQDQRPKVEDYPGALFAVIHRLAPEPDGAGLSSQEIHAFLTAEALVTVHDGPVREIDRMFERCAGDPSLLSRGADFALYLVYDAVTDAHFALADALTDQIDDLVAEVAADQTGADLMARILAARREHALLRRRLAPQREVIATLARPGQGRVKEQNAIFYRDVLDHLVRITEEIDVGRDLIGSTMDVHLALVNNRLNAVMARLALVSTIFLPLTFLTGFFGMNLPNLPGRWGMGLMLAAMAVLPPAMWLWFKNKRWF
jgi:magnesium transporter